MSGAPLGASGLALIAAGLVATGLVGWAAEMANGPVLVARLQQGAGKALASTHARGVVASFADRHGWLTRHALLAGGDNLPDGLREQAAAAVAELNELGARGIDLAGLRARGLGSARPVPGLDAADPANRRIEFSVIAPASLEPTPVDTPGAG